MLSNHAFSSGTISYGYQQIYPKLVDMSQ